MEAEKNADLILHRVPTQILVSLVDNIGKSYASKLSKKSGTYAHVVRELQKMKKLGWITIEKYGRIKFVKLTEKGMSIAKKVKEVEMELGGFREFPIHL
jgi:Mn-dependent DtxR family transcriptional regulator